MSLTNPFTKAILILLFLSMLCSNVHASGDRNSYFTPTYHTNNTPSGGAMIVDAIFARPLGIFATVVGTAVYTVSLPFSLSGGNEHEARQNLVYSPASYTFRRPLGEFYTTLNID